LKALANRFEDHREGGVFDGHLEQLGRPLTLLPQRGPAAGVASGQQQGSCGALAEAGCEQRRPPDLAGHEVVDLIGLEDDHVGTGWLGIGVGNPDHDAVVGRHRLAVDAVALAEAGVDRQRPWCVHWRAVRRVDHQPPVAQLVAESLDDEALVAGDDLGRLPLFGDVADEVFGRERVQSVLFDHSPALSLGEPGQLTMKLADRCPQFGRAAQGVALPERQPAGDAGCGGDEHLVVGDVLDAPGSGAEGEDVADP
jgi:hypothetical protein